METEAQNKMNLSRQLSIVINKMIAKGYGTGRMFNHIRSMQNYSDITDLGILRFILVKQNSFGKFPSKEKIRHHLRTKVDPDEWKGSSKNEILKDLYNPIN